MNVSKNKTSKNLIKQLNDDKQLVSLSTCLLECVALHGTLIKIKVVECHRHVHAFKEFFDTKLPIKTISVAFKPELFNHISRVKSVT